jgi:hypothetical protein
MRKRAQRDAIGPDSGSRWRLRGEDAGYADCSSRQTVPWPSVVHSNCKFTKWTKADNASVVERSYDHVTGQIPRVPYVEPGSVQTVLDQLAPQVAAAATAKPDEFYDNRWLRELENSGYVRSLYQ